jgi:epsilon-lactone hydrolase
MKPANITMRPLTDADAKARASLRPFLAPHKGESGDIASSRAAFDAIMQRVPAAQNIEYATDTIGGVPGIWCRPPNPTNRTVLHLHGGWFVSGTADAYRNFVGQIAARTNAAAFVPEYRLAPEHPFPGAVDDVQAVYKGLIERGLRELVIVGDSAGGSLALELLARILRDPSAVQAKGAVLLSPVTDLSLAAVSWESRDAADLLFTNAQVSRLVDMYVGGANPSLPFSSLTSDLTGFPPMLIHVGDDEVLLDDSFHLAQRASDAGVDVRLDVWEGMLHVFQSSFAMFEAANTALDEIATFIRDAGFNPEAFVRNAYAVAERKDLEGWKSMFNPDGIFTDESVKITYKDGNWDYPVKNYGTAFADMHRELYDMWHIGNTVFVRLALQGTHTGPLETPFGTIAPTGKKMDAPCFDVFELENGKIKKFDCYPEGSIILTQLGVMDVAVSQNKA